MQNLEPVPTEIISTEDYQPTEIPNMFIHATGGDVVIVGLDVAYRISVKK